jgi:hypothetical protein
MVQFKISLPPESQFTSLANWDLTNIAIALINLIITVAILSAVFNIFFGGLLYILSGGDDEKVTKAVRRITNAIVGLLIVLSVYTIAGLMSNFLGVNLLYFQIIGING